MAVSVAIEAKPVVEIWRWHNKSTFWPWFPIHSFEQFLATIQNATDRQVTDDRRQTDRRPWMWPSFDHVLIVGYWVACTRGEVCSRNRLKIEGPRSSSYGNLKDKEHRVTVTRLIAYNFSFIEWPTYANMQILCKLAQNVVKNSISSSWKSSNSNLNSKLDSKKFETLLRPIHRWHSTRSSMYSSNRFSW